jgi:hypothetical protein
MCQNQAKKTKQSGIYHIIRVEERIVDGNDLHIRVVECGTEDQTTDTTESAREFSKERLKVAIEYYPLIPILTTIVNC